MSSHDSRELIELRSLHIGKWANLFMGVSGIAAAYASHSDALLVDGLYSVVNFVSAIIAAQISMSILQPADKWFPFGYDAYEALYVKYRSLVLLGIMSFAAFSAVSKIITYVVGGELPELVFGPILIYMVLMILICFGLAAWHRHNWKQSGCQSELLSTESSAAVVDGIISVGAGGGLLASALLRGTALEVIVPISDSIIVLIISVIIVRQPLRMFLQSLREVAGGAADPVLVEKIRMLTVQMSKDIPVEILAVPVMKLGRNYFVVPYLKPVGAVSAEEVDAFRSELVTAYAEFMSQVKTEIIITAENPYPS
jgi:divalent metal cation (Fe/Co/Zn/Cd) transporter